MGACCSEQARRLKLPLRNIEEACKGKAFSPELQSDRLCRILYRCALSQTAISQLFVPGIDRVKPGICWLHVPLTHKKLGVSRDITNYMFDAMFDFPAAGLQGKDPEFASYFLEAGFFCASRNRRMRSSERDLPKTIMLSSNGGDMVLPVMMARRSMKFSLVLH
jgi:hypothetical protein